MLPIEWDNDKMSLDIDLIDNQHKQLLTIINQLTTINTNSQKKDIIYIINKLIDYARFHFSTEENLFNQFNYLDSNEHKMEHQNFIDKFKEIRKRLEKKSSYEKQAIIDLSEDIYEYISNWLIKHILGRDKKYAKLIKVNKKTLKIKDITVIYVEDEIELKEYFTKILKLKIKNVHSFLNGKEALEFYKEKKADIDLIISDINMPCLNGIDLLKQIRIIDKEIPYIITSAFLETEHLLDAITHNITYYFQKPINMNELFKKIDNLFYRKVNQLKINHQKNEIETYFDALNDVAFVSKVDVEGNFTYVNDLYCEVFKYKREELIGKSYNVVLHPDTPKNIINEIRETIQSGKKWKGRIKNISKDGTFSYVSTTIFPLYDNEDNNISGYIIIKFLITDLIEEKREFKKNIMSNLLDYKKVQFNSSKRISTLEENLSKLNKEINFYQNNNHKIETKYKKSLSQVDFYEKSIKEKDIQYKRIVELYKINLQKTNDAYKKLLRETEKNRKETSEIKRGKELRTKEIIKLNEKLNEQAYIISGLRDTIKNIT